MIALALIYSGDPKEGEPLVEPLRKFGTPWASISASSLTSPGSRPSIRC